MKLRALVIEGLTVIGELTEEGCDKGEKMVFGFCREVGNLKASHPQQAQAAEVASSKALAKSQKAFKDATPYAHATARAYHLSAGLAHTTAAELAPDEETAAKHNKAAVQHWGHAAKHLPKKAAS
jgi:hypothetical protein